MLQRCIFQPFTHIQITTLQGNYFCTPLVYLWHHCHNNYCFLIGSINSFITSSLLHYIVRTFILLHYQLISIAQSSTQGTTFSYVIGITTQETTFSYTIDITTLRNYTTVYEFYTSHCFCGESVVLLISRSCYACYKTILLTRRNRIHSKIRYTTKENEVRVQLLNANHNDIVPRNSVTLCRKTECSKKWKQCFSCERCLWGTVHITISRCHCQSKILVVQQWVDMSSGRFQPSRLTVTMKLWNQTNSNQGDWTSGSYQKGDNLDSCQIGLAQRSDCHGNPDV